MCKKNSAASSSSKEAAPSKPAKQVVTPLCGGGYYQWLSMQNGNLKKSGPQYIERPTVGLQNQENTCYLNAVLQCLVHTTLLRECLMQAYPRPRPEEEWLTELLQLFREVDEARGSKRSVSASRIASLITRNKEFERGQQADAHEALMLILSRLLDECLAVGDGSGRALSDAEYAAKEQLERCSLVGHVFGMDLGQTVRCDSCSYESATVRVEYCCCLNVTLGMSDRELQALRTELQQQQLGSPSYRSTSQETGAPETTLENLLREYTKGEHIDEYKCEKCRRSGCTREAYVARRPNVLVAYIDRRQDAGLYGKINRRVRFPQRFDFSPFLHSRNDWADTNHTYSLYGIVVHRDVNRSTFFGHYVAYVRDKTSQWYLLDDTRVEQVTWSSVQEQHAYLLLYTADQVLPPQSFPAPAPTPAVARQPLVPQAQERQPQQESASTGSTASNASSLSTAASLASSPRSSSAHSTAVTRVSTRGAAATSGQAAEDSPSSRLSPPEQPALEMPVAPEAAAAVPEPPAEFDAAEAEAEAEEADIESMKDILAKLDQEEAREQVELPLPAATPVAEAEAQPEAEVPPTVTSPAANAKESGGNGLFDFDMLDELEC